MLYNMNAALRVLAVVVLLAKTGASEPLRAPISNNRDDPAASPGQLNNEAAARQRARQENSWITTRIKQEYGMAYVGCFLESPDTPERYENVEPDVHTCMKHCQSQGYQFAAIQKLRKCSCSFDLYGTFGSSASSELCSKTCSTPEKCPSTTAFVFDTEHTESTAPQRNLFLGLGYFFGSSTPAPTPMGTMTGSMSSTQVGSSEGSSDGFIGKLKKGFNLGGGDGSSLPMSVLGFVSNKDSDLATVAPTMDQSGVGLDDFVGDDSVDDKTGDDKTGGDGGVGFFSGVNDLFHNAFNSYMGGASVVDGAEEVLDISEDVETSAPTLADSEEGDGEEIGELLNGFFTGEDTTISPTEGADTDDLGAPTPTPTFDLTPDASEQDSMDNSELTTVPQVVHPGYHLVQPPPNVILTGSANTWGGSSTTADVSTGLTTLVDAIFNHDSAYVGCYKDDDVVHSMHFGSHSNHNVGTCRRYCKERGYDYAGLKKGHLCYCDNCYDDYGEADSEGDCDIDCTFGGSTDVCGGDQVLSVWHAKDVSAAPTQAPTTSPAPTADSDTRDAVVGYEGCYNDDSTNRAMDLDAGEGYESIEACIDKCLDEEKKYAGMEGGDHCWCTSNASYNRHGQADSLACDQPCSEGGGLCGGVGKLSVYDVKEATEAEKRSRD